MKFNTFTFFIFSFALQLTLNLFAGSTEKFKEAADIIQLSLELAYLEQFANQEIESVNINGSNLAFNQFINHFNAHIAAHTHLINNTTSLNEEFKKTKLFIENKNRELMMAIQWPLVTPVISPIIVATRSRRVFAAQEKKVWKEFDSGPMWFLGNRSSRPSDDDTPSK